MTTGLRLEKVLEHHHYSPDPMRGHYAYFGNNSEPFSLIVKLVSILSNSAKWTKEISERFCVLNLSGRASYRRTSNKCSRKYFTILIESRSET